MRHKQEDIDKMAHAMCGLCTVDKHCIIKQAQCIEVANQDCSYKESAEMLLDKCYGNVSEYKAEIDKLRAGNKIFANNMKAILEIEKKQSQIDALNKVKGYINNKIESDYGDMSDSVNYLTIDIEDFDNFISELIKEVQNEQKDQ